ncbi:Chemotaxis protein CheC -- inhibitor of MCP methylation [hydrothermal vent metagenome]|uniref:Chemotaxis protein CheC -- inhibitor of MCP methylation n=1 Tax=hydrothermal vent metagenome TaxID=652676 RepID=A0A3B0YI88_9ZZZZ
MPDPIQLSELEEDLLAELFNLGVGNAAASLSTMVKQEIKLSVPQIEFLTVKELADKLGADNSICSVSLLVSGPFSAQSMLLFPEKNSMEIVRKLLGEDLPEDTLIELQKEAFSEIGNIVLNACIGSLSSAMHEEFKLDLPVFELAKPGELLGISKNKNDTALFIRINLTLSASEITGYMAFLMGTLSLEQLKGILAKMLSDL